MHLCSRHRDLPELNTGYFITFIDKLVKAPAPANYELVMVFALNVVGSEHLRGHAFSTSMSMSMNTSMNTSRSLLL